MGNGGAGVRECPACGKSAALLLRRYSRESWRVVRCGACGFVYLQNAPAYHQLRAELAWEKSFGAHAQRKAREYPLLSWLDRATRWRLRLFRPDEAAQWRRLFPPGAVLDVGCGSGERIPRPFIPFGVEISEALARRADAVMRERGGACICAPATEGVERLPESYFSAVVMRSFLEHEAQPKRLLRAVARVLRADGVVYVKVPNYGSVNRIVMGARWCGFRYPDHVNYFTLRSLRRMANETGFHLRLLNPINLAFDDNIHAMLRKAT